MKKLFLVFLMVVFSCNVNAGQYHKKKTQQELYDRAIYNLDAYTNGTDCFYIFSKDNSVSQNGYDIRYTVSLYKGEKFLYSKYVILNRSNFSSQLSMTIEIAKLKCTPVKEGKKK